MKKKIIKWLNDEKIPNEEKLDGCENFNLLIYFPDENHTMNIVQPYGKNDVIVIGCGTKVDEYHLKKMKETGSREMRDYLMNFRILLNNYPVDFQLDIVDNILCSFLITDEIYLDGLTKDRFISSIKKVFKVKLQAIWDIQKTFGNPEETAHTFDADSFVFE